MASSDNQYVHIALIILFGLTLVLLVTTIMFFQQSQEADGRARKDAVVAKEKSDSLLLVIGERDKLKTFIGVKETDEIPAIQETFDADVNKFKAAVPADKLFYRDAVDALLAGLAKAQAESVAAKSQIATLEAVNAAFAKNADEKVKAAEDAKQKALADLAQQQQAFMEAQKKVEAEKKEVAEQLAKVQQDSATAVEKVKKESETVQTKVTQEIARSKDLAEKVKRLTGQTYAVNDGEIRSIDQRTRTVWINLGEADLLRPQITFTVHAPGQRASNDVTKAKIEVTRITGEHLAEARILEDSMKDPIVPGDRLFTSLWDPGRPEHFAIAGRIDLTGDGQDDRDMLKNLIELNGGIVDAELQPDGTIKGNMTVDTSYLVLGPFAGGAQASREGYNVMTKTAEQFGAHTLSADGLLDHIGWHDTNALVRFGRDSNIETVPVREAPDGGFKQSAPATSGIFKSRRPPTASSAY